MQHGALLPGTEHLLLQSHVCQREGGIVRMAIPGQDQPDIQRCSSGQGVLYPPSEAWGCCAPLRPGGHLEEHQALVGH